MAQYRVPLSEGAQSFAISLGDFQYMLTLVFRDAEGGGWFLDMVRADGSGQIYGIPLVLGVDLLAQHKHLGFGGLFAQMEGGAGRYPTYEDMGKLLTLIWDDGNAD